MPDSSNDRPRLIEVDFPLKETSIDSVHEKSVRHGHISTLHVWPARRPLAASRAALIATLLVDPADIAERRTLKQRIAGVLKQKVVKKKKADGATSESIKEYTEGGILHWGEESNVDLGWFRELIRNEFGGRAPRVLDPFSGGGAIPLEAMRLGCKATAVDINPVAWFILRCTLEYPQRLAGQQRALPSFAQNFPGLLDAIAKVAGGKTGSKGKTAVKRNAAESVHADLFDVPQGDLAAHVSAWGWRVLERAKSDLSKWYPVVNGQPAVAYLWARTVTCKNCRATVPLLKSKWLCKKEEKRVLLVLTPIDGNIQYQIIIRPKTTVAEERKVGAGTMSQSGASCPHCPTINTQQDIALEGQAGRIRTTLIAVVTDGRTGKEYRLPTKEELDVSEHTSAALEEIFREIPFGMPDEPIPKGSSRKGGGSAFTVHLYGVDRWCKLFTSRQLAMLGTFARHVRAIRTEIAEAGYPADWQEALTAYLALIFDRLANQSSAVSRWHKKGEKVEGTFSRFALPIVWDYAEVNPLGATTGGFISAIDWVTRALVHLLKAAVGQPAPDVLRRSATAPIPGTFDIVVTDPPYYDAIPYADLMDFFYVWLRRILSGVSSEFDAAFHDPLSPKWDHATADGELIDDSGRFGGDKAKSKAAYEDGMARAFEACRHALEEQGRLVIVFAHKQPDAWETLVSAVIKAGFVVDGSWPIQTEMTTRTRARSSAALSSSVWLVCKRRPDAARPGWDNKVLAEMRERIYLRLRDFWDAGIRGPDFVWAATGPAMEAYSKHPVVKKANEPGQVMTVSEFLRAVRRIVVDFVVGRVLSPEGSAEGETGLDDVTTYYLLHRHDFGMGEAPSGACILYAVSCNLSDKALVDQCELIIRTGDGPQDDEEEDDDDIAEDEGEAATEAAGDGKGSKFKLRTWNQRKKRGLGYDVEARPAPLIDRVHRLMQLWKAGEQTKVDEFIEGCALRKNALFVRLLQALIELSGTQNEERSTLESIMNHLSSRGAAPEKKQFGLPGLTAEGTNIETR